MSIASEISRLQGAKAGLKTSIEAKGVTVSSDATLDDYPDYVDAIQTGGGSNLQTKSVSYTPSETAISSTVNPDAGYDGMSSVSVSVYAISSTYVGTGITRRTSTDLSASGATVTAPAGYYENSASKAIANASTPYIDAAYIDNSGNLSVDIEVDDGGYIGPTTISSTLNGAVSVQGAQTIYPSTSDQTIASGEYLTGAQTIKAVTTTNLTAANIKKDVVVEVGDSADSDRIVSVTGTYEGGGDPNPTASQKDVNFIDYDGTIRYSYTYAEAEALSALPSLPVHDGLTGDGWNWTLQDLTDQLAVDKISMLWIGAVYNTTSGATEVDIEIPKNGFHRYFLRLTINGTVSIDWGDGTTPDTVTASGTEASYEHRYASSIYGTKTIKIKETSGTYNLMGDYNSSSPRYGFVRGSAVRYDQAYQSSVVAVRVGGGVHTLYNGCFSAFRRLKYVTIPNSISSFNVMAFRNCVALQSITMPYQKGFGSNKFYNCLGLRTVSYSNHPVSGTLNYGDELFYACYSLANVHIANGIPTIGTNTFGYTYSLLQVVIPSSVTSIGANAFNNSNVNYIHMLGTTPPTLANNNALSSSAVVTIYVPYSADHSVLNTYKTASVWSNYASKMQEEPQ